MTRTARKKIFSSAAIEIFRRMQRVDPQTELWHNLRSQLHDVLGLQPWEFLEHPSSVDRDPPYQVWGSVQAKELYRALAAASARKMNVS